MRQNEALRKLGGSGDLCPGPQLLFILLEVFTAFYSRIPEPIEHFRAVAPWMWTSVILAIAALVLFGLRRDEKTLALACAATLVSLWIDKGLGMVIGGFVPSPLGSVTAYVPTAPEIAIAAGIWAAAALVATLLFRSAIAVRNYAQGGVL